MKRIYYGWWVVMAAFGSLFVCAGIGFFTFPVFLKHIAADMNWGRDSLSHAAALSAVSAGFITPLIGYLIDRYGTRAVMVAGVIVLSVSFLLLARVSEVYQLYILFLLLGAGMSAATLLPSQTLITRWFEKRRGRAMGIITVANGLGGVVWMNVADLLIKTGGWRHAYTVLGFLVMAVALPVVGFIVRNSPENMGISTLEHAEFSAAPGAGGDGMGQEGRREPGFTLKEAFGTWSFWLICSATFFVMFAASGFGLHIVAFLSDRGLSSQHATAVWSISLGVSILGRFAFGFVAEHYQKRIMASVANSLRALSIFMLVLFAVDLMPTGISLVQLVLIYGLAQGCNAVLNPLLIGETFGIKAFGKIMGFLGIPFTLGTALGQSLGGLLFEVMDNYVIAFGAFSLSLLLAGCCVVFAKPYFYTARR